MLPESLSRADNLLDPRLVLRAARQLGHQRPHAPLQMDEILSFLDRQNFPLLSLHQAFSDPVRQADLGSDAAILQELALDRWTAAVAVDGERYRASRGAFGAVASVWAAAGIPAICLKSAGIAPSFPYRSRAVDAMVPATSVARARGLLAEQGYIEMRNSEEPGKWLFRRFVAGRSVSAIHLHAGVRWQEEFVLLDEFWRRARPAADDAEIRIPGPEDSLLVNMAHVVMQKREINLHDLIKVKWVLADDFDWGYVDRVVTQRGWADGFALGLVLAAWLDRFLFDVTEIPAAVEADARERIARNPLLKAWMAQVHRSPSLPFGLPTLPTRAAFYGKIWSDRDLNVRERVGHSIVSGARDLRGALRITPQRSMLISLSGIDGSGKSSHTDALLNAFGTAQIRIGWVTARIGNKTPLRRLAQWVRSSRYRRQLGSPSGSPAMSPPGKTVEGHWRGWRLTLWALATAADYGIWLQYVRWKLLRGNVVVSDRYVCDFAVEFSILVKSQPTLAALLLKPLWWIAPRPHCSYFLRIRPEMSQARKPDDQHGYDHFQVVAMYDELYGRYGLRPLDNHENFDHVAGIIVHETLSTYMRRFHPLQNELFFSSSRGLNP